MGKYTQGILGSFTGKVGAVIGSSWKGISIMRGLARRSNKAPTAEQLAQRARFSLAVEFLKPAMPLLTLGFKNVGIRQTGYNVALARMLDESRAAIIGDYPSLLIDYSRVQLSEGPLAPAQTVSLSSGAAGQVVIEWGLSAGNSLADPTDKVMLLLYEASGARYVVNTAGAARSEQQHTLTAAELSGNTVHVWIAFISADGKKVSSSVYAGELDVN